MESLTNSERRVFDYLVSFWENNGFSPSVREIRDALGFASTSTVHLYLSRLSDKGYVEKENAKSRSLRPLLHASPEDVPLLGTVRAGAPILAEELYEEDVRFADAPRYPKGSLFALRVVGDSMIEAGILEGDTVIVCRDLLPGDGEIVVALLGEEATVKTLYREHGHIRLQPENARLSPIITDSAVILGKVVACLRTY